MSDRCSRSSERQTSRKNRRNDDFEDDPAELRRREKARKMVENNDDRRRHSQSEEHGYKSHDDGEIFERNNHSDRENEREKEKKHEKLKKRAKKDDRRRRSTSKEGDDRRRRSTSKEGDDRRRRSTSKEGDDRRRRLQSNERDHGRRGDEKVSKRRRKNDSDFEDDRRKRRRHEKSRKESTDETPEIKKKTVDLSLTRAGGAYIPPAKLKLMMEQQMDKSTEQYQRMNWDRLKKKIHGQVNKANVDNIVQVVRELLQENVIRGKGLLAQSIIQAQSFSPSFSHVYAALVSIINSKFPNIGELILRRLVIQFKRAFRTNNKQTCVQVSTFIGHLANQRVCHELLILQILVVLMENPTDDSIEIAINLLKVCGQMLTHVTPQGTFAMFEQLRKILEECDEITSRTQYMIEVLFAVRKEKFAAYPSVIEELDLIDEEDQVCHLVNLVSEDNKPLDPETGLNVFKFDEKFEENEKQYDEIRSEIIGDADDSDEEQGEGNGGEGGEKMEEDDEESEVPKPTTNSGGTMKIIDMTEQEKAAFRRNVYLTIQSSLDFQEAAHKLIKNFLKPGIEAELCHMIVDCCAQQRSYTPFYGKLAERFCKLRKEFQDEFEAISKESYKASHRFDQTKLRNLALLVAHLLATDAISWEVFSVVKLTENDTTSAGRIFLKTIFIQLCEHLGMIKLDERLHDPTMYQYYEGLFPRDHPKNSRFAINYFSFIGMSALTLDLRKFLQKKEKKMKKEPAMEEESISSSSSESSGSNSSDSESSDSGSSSDSSSSSTSSASSDHSRRKKKSKLPIPLKNVKREIE